MTQKEVKEIIPPETGQANKKSGFFGRLKTYLLTGLLVTAPATIAVYIAYIIVIGIDKRVVTLIPEKYNPSSYLPFGIPGLGLLILFAFLVFIGFMTSGLFGRFLMRWWERMLNKTPLVSSFYGALKQIFETILSNKSNAFRTAVLVEFPRRDCWTIAFITGKSAKEIQSVSPPDDELINLYVPTTPNPTSGYFVMVPKKDIRPLDMPVEMALKYVISTGLVANKESNCQK